MCKAALVAAIAVTIAFSAAAQGVDPAQGTTPPAPGASAPASPPAPAARMKRGAMAGADLTPAPCDQGSPADIRKCKARNVAVVQKAIVRKVMEICQKQLAVTGTRGPAAADERIACRYDMMTKLLESIK